MKILDLGLARFLQDQLGDAHLTQEGMGMGTPDYMAPEQFRDALHADARTDIYGLGCTAYHLIAGQVPFPGTSFSEKAHAHAKKEPIPLEERCPEVSAGLAVIVQKMMAKHPAERFQSASAVAEAIAPYVAGSSQSMIRLRQTGEWPPGQTTMRMPARGKRMVAGASAVAASALGLCLLVFLWPGLFGLGPTPPGGARPPDDGPNKPPDHAKDVADATPAKPQIVTIDNGLTVAKDGTGQFSTIAAALLEVKPGMTIRVLDDATYEEALAIRDRVRHAGITLESPLRATLALPKTANMGLTLVAPRVTLRGFRFRMDKAGGFSVGVGGPNPGILLEGLEFRAHQQPSQAISIEGLACGLGQDPLTIRNCSIDGYGNGIQVLGKILANGQPYPCRGILLRDNKITNAQKGIVVVGSIRELAIAGNTISSCVESAFHFEDLFADSADILIANNTLMNPHHSLQLIEPMAAVKNVRVQSNLVLAERGPDFVNLTKNPKAAASWLIEKNWRQFPRVEPADPEFASWMQSAQDQVVADLPLLSRDPKHKDFLRPGADSPLGKAGVDGDLPGFVGAVPPEGAAPWNWQWTWDALVHQRLTVSKEPKTGGRFRTIGAALKAVKPKMTIRVLDAEKYAEPLVIDDAKSHEGLVLEAPAHATLVLGEDSPQAVLLRGVANVRVRGFRFEDAGSTRRMPFFVFVGAGCPGLILEELRGDALTKVSGITFVNTVMPPDADPIIVRKCQLNLKEDGIVLTGLPKSPVSRVMILDNRIKGSNGILFDQGVHDVVVAGNLVWHCTQAGIQFQDPLPITQRILVANNTVFDNQVAVRIWREALDDKLEKAEIEFRNNILMASQAGDMVYYRQAPGVAFGNVKDSQMLLDLWRFGQNFRDLAGSDALQVTPLAKDDRKLDPTWLVSRIAADPDFLRPKAGSPLVADGAGGDLPSYVGAVPPDGSAAWDWQKTWKARKQAKN